MPRLRVHNFSVSLDGYAAGPEQSLEDPLGRGGMRVHEWMLATRHWRQGEGLDGGTEGVDDAMARAWNVGIGATIMGRHMFGPVRGEWPDESWVGWWGEDPPYHNDVFVLTHHPRPSVAMAGGTTFHFVAGAPEEVLRMAFDAAGGHDVLLGGGAATLQQFLRAGLVDELNLAIAPVLLGSGERLFDNLDGAMERYECVSVTSGEGAMHARLVRT